MDNSIWYHFLEGIENLQMFSLCNDFDALSLEDRGSSSSTSLVKSYSYSYGFIDRFLHSCRSDPLSKSIIELLRAPFLELPRHFLDSSRFKSDDLYLSIGFRFTPNQHRMLNEDLLLPKSFDRLFILSKSLGLSFNKSSLTRKLLFSWSSSGAGLRGLVNESFNKILVEVISYSNGFYGRFLVLVSLGVCCNVWYGFAPGLPDQPPVGTTLFTPYDTYDPFFKIENSVPGLRRICFVESSDVSASVESAYRNELPFSGITIPANGPVLKAVSLGLMVAIFLALGIVPDVSSAINEQL